MNSPDESIFKLCPPRSKSRPPDETNTPFVIMYHGTLVERNGVDLAVEALARLRESVPTAELRIYGYSTPFLERVMRSVGENGLHKAVRYLGPRGLEQLVEAIKECDVGVIPNKRSIFTEINTPVRIFEYLALGKPVIAPRAPGIQDYFGDDSLVTFELGNAEDLALKLAHVFFHPDEAFEVVKRGQDVYLAHTWHEERTKLLNVAAELLSTGHRMA
jgi:glycosyltransferase involved in cell wall biosynthesis